METRLKRVDWWEEALAHLSHDPKLRPTIAASEGEGLLLNHALFPTMLRAVCGQQVSNAAAQTLYANLRFAVRGRGALSERILALGAEGVRRTGLSPTKTKAVLAISQAARSGVISRAAFKPLSDDSVLKRLCELPGIGAWTGQMILIFGLNRPDVLAETDLGVRLAVEQLYGSKRVLREISASWHPFCTAATWLLWRSRSKTPVQY